MMGLIDSQETVALDGLIVVIARKTAGSYASRQLHVIYR